MERPRSGGFKGWLERHIVTDQPQSETVLQVAAQTSRTKAELDELAEIAKEDPGRARLLRFLRQDMGPGVVT